MNNITAPDEAIRVYWMTGCSSCLRTKEFLTRHGVSFISRNVLEDEGAYDELARFGLAHASASSASAKKSGPPKLPDFRASA